MPVDVEVVTGWTAAACVGLPGAALLGGSGVFETYRRAVKKRLLRERSLLSADASKLQPGDVSLAGTAELIDGQRELSPAFLLKLESGTRVRVESGKQQLEVGAQVLARGVLHGEISARPNAERATLKNVKLSTAAFDGELQRRVDDSAFAALSLLITAIATQVFYLGFYVEALLHAFGKGGPPTIVIAIYFWVALISGSVFLGATLSTLRRW